ncbi:SCP2 domain-containing protein [Ideonella sp.]|uniref:ubiquinone anaerobic biosynthesis accessory factor UbiT n=1 Tax=Ideonella sp. TaxID=1929293 RepID=UPI0035B3F7BA
MTPALSPHPTPDLPLPPGMPAWMAPLHRRVAATVGRLPSHPPSWLAAQALNRWLLPQLPGDARAALRDRVVALRVRDLGLRLHLRLDGGRFVPAGDQAEPALWIEASSAAYAALARGEEDPDRLFFDRRLVMEGDTELGLVLKNTLDAIGPAWLPWRR